MCIEQCSGHADFPEVVSEGDVRIGVGCHRIWEAGHFLEGVGH